MASRPSRGGSTRWRESLLTNVYAPYLLARLCAPGMKKQGWGRIINVSSAAGFAPPEAAGCDYVLSIGAPAAQTNGKFFWIEDGIQKPRPT